MKTNKVVKFRPYENRQRFEIVYGTTPKLVADNKKTISFSSSMKMVEFIRDMRLAGRVRNLFSLSTLMQGIAWSAATHAFKKAKAA